VAADNTVISNLLSSSEATRRIAAHRVAGPRTRADLSPRINDCCFAVVDVVFICVARIVSST